MELKKIQCSQGPTTIEVTAVQLKDNST